MRVDVQPVEAGEDLGRSNHAPNQRAPYDGWRASTVMDGPRRPWAFGATKGEALKRLADHIDRIEAKMERDDD